MPGFRSTPPPNRNIHTEVPACLGELKSPGSADAWLVCPSPTSEPDGLKPNIQHNLQLWAFRETKTRGPVCSLRVQLLPPKSQGVLSPTVGGQTPATLRIDENTANNCLINHLQNGLGFRAWTARWLSDRQFQGRKAPMFERHQGKAKYIDEPSNKAPEPFVRSRFAFCKILFITIVTR